jgi:hypothetical protein
MGGITPLVTTALPLANSVIGTVRNASAGQSGAAAQQAAQQAAAELEYKRQQDAPLPFTLLSVTMDMKVND